MPDSEPLSNTNHQGQSKQVVNCDLIMSAISINFLTTKDFNIYAGISKTYCESRQFLIYYLKFILLFLFSVFRQICQARKKKRKWHFFAISKQLWLPVPNQMYQAKKKKKTHEMVHTHQSTCMPAHYRIMLLRLTSMHFSAMRVPF